jgi:hypothetical protein
MYICIIILVRREEFCARSQKSSVAPDDYCCHGRFPKMILGSCSWHSVCILLCFSMTSCEANKFAKDGMIFHAGRARARRWTFSGRVRGRFDRLFFATVSIRACLYKQADRARPMVVTRLFEPKQKLLRDFCKSLYLRSIKRCEPRGKCKIHLTQMSNRSFLLYRSLFDFSTVRVKSISFVLCAVNLSAFGMSVIPAGYGFVLTHCGGALRDHRLMSDTPTA